MKKTVAFLLCILCLFSCIGCSLFGKDYEADAKSFEFEGLTITLTEAFREDSIDSESVWYESASETSVSIDKFTLSEMDKAANISLSEFAKSMADELPYRKVSNVKTNGGLIYIECEVETLGFEFMYFISFYKSADAFWVACFMCDLEDYADYEEHFIKWARSVEPPVDK